MDPIKFLREISGIPCVSGREFALAEWMADRFGPDFDESYADAAGNCVLVRKAKKQGLPKVLLEAHLDEVGVCVKEILEGGFVSVTNRGGLDVALLPGT